MITSEAKEKLRIDAGIPHTPTDLTFDARMAVIGSGPLAAEWEDKPHRLVYDLCREIERLNAPLGDDDALDAVCVAFWNATHGKADSWYDLSYHEREDIRNGMLAALSSISSNT